MKNDTKNCNCKNCTNAAPGRGSKKQDCNKKSDDK